MSNIIQGLCNVDLVDQVEESIALHYSTTLIAHQVLVGQKSTTDMYEHVNVFLICCVYTMLF